MGDFPSWRSKSCQAETQSLFDEANETSDNKTWLLNVKTQIEKDRCATERDHHVDAFTMWLTSSDEALFVIFFVFVLLFFCDLYYLSNNMNDSTCTNSNPMIYEINETNLSSFENLLRQEDFVVILFYNKVIKERFLKDEYVEISDLPIIPYPEYYAIDIDFARKKCGSWLEKSIKKLAGVDFNRHVNLVLFKNGEEKFRFTDFTDVSRIEKKINNIKNTCDIIFLSDLPGTVEHVFVDVLDKIEKGQKLLELNVDKGTVVFYSPVNGTVLNVNISEEQTVCNQEVMFTVIRN